MLLSSGSGLHDALGFQLLCNLGCCFLHRRPECDEDLCEEGLGEGGGCPDAGSRLQQGSAVLVCSL